MTSLMHLLYSYIQTFESSLHTENHLVHGMCGRAGCCLGKVHGQKAEVYCMLKQSPKITLNHQFTRCGASRPNIKLNCIWDIHDLQTQLKPGLKQGKLPA